MKRPPLLSDVEVRGSCSDDIDMDPIYVRDTYEEARAKDTELIQRLVDGWYAADGGRNMWAAIAAAEAAGFKPSEP